MKFTKIIFLTSLFSIALSQHGHARQVDSHSQSTEGVLAHSSPKQIPQIKEKNLGIEAKVDALLKKMSVMEKCGQLQQFAGPGEGTIDPSYPELAAKGMIGSTLNVRGAENTNKLQKIAIEKSPNHIPILFAYDTIHGQKTIFPVPLGEASSWDAKLAEKTAHAAAKEASAMGLKWTFAPMVDIARDPRWGRVVEGAGEDPYLGSVLAKARVKGFQGDDISDKDRVMATAKHFVAYGAAVGGRDYGEVEMSSSTLNDIYLPPFRAAAEQNVGSMMCSFNTLNGVPCSGNEEMIKGVLKNDWKYPGLVVSDYESVAEMVEHGYAKDPKNAAQLALNAGVDMEMKSQTYCENIQALLNDGSIKIETLNEAARRVLRKKFELGLFDNPFVDPEREKFELETPAAKELARTAAARSIVLLKNNSPTDGGKPLLPLNPNSGQSIAVIGPLADDHQSPLGSWLGDGKENSAVSALDGIKSKLNGSESKILYVKGVNTVESTDPKVKNLDEIKKAVDAAKKSDRVVMVLGESDKMTGESTSRSDLSLPGRQRELLEEVLKVNKNVVLVLMNGRPLAIPNEVEKTPAVVEAWLGGSQAGNGLADVLFGDVNPSGKLPITFPRSVGQIPIYYNHPSGGRPNDPNNSYTSRYIDDTVDPLFPFGSGLSYSKFELSDFKIDKSNVGKGESVKAQVKVKNLSNIKGDEVVQFYIRDHVASITQPVKALKGFERVTLDGGQSQLIKFEIPYEELGFHDRHGNYIVEPGSFSMFAGQDSASGLESTFEIK